MPKRKKIKESKRAEAMKLTGGACYYCGAFATELDHFIPWSYAPNDTLWNLIPACSICNSIANNAHFETLEAKKKFILFQRSSRKWRTKIARMEVIVVNVDENGQPTGIVTIGKTDPDTPP